MQRTAILLSAVSLAPSYFWTLSHNGTIFGKDVIEHEMSVLIFFHLLFETFLVIRRIQRDIVTSVKRSSCKILVILVGF